MTWGLMVSTLSLPISAAPISTPSTTADSSNQITKTIDVKARMTDVLTSLKRAPLSYADEPVNKQFKVPLKQISSKADIQKANVQPVLAKKNNAKYGFVENSYIVTFKSPEKGKSHFIKRPDKAFNGLSSVPFGQHRNGQRPSDIAAKLKLKGEVLSIHDAINSVHVSMNAKEAQRLARDKRVLRVEQDRYLNTTTAVQNSPGWALDVTDSLTVSRNNAYDYTFTGAGRTIYILDTGLNLGTQAVDDEFDGRASVLWDVNGAGGADCNGHGSMVASAAAGIRTVWPKVPQWL